MKEYRLFEQSMYDKAVGFYKAYGISLFADGRPVRIIRDVSVDRSKVEALVLLFNEEDLQPEHMEEMIENFLYDFSV